MQKPDDVIKQIATHKRRQVESEPVNTLAVPHPTKVEDNTENKTAKKPTPQTHARSRYNWLSAREKVNYAEDEGSSEEDEINDINKRLQAILRNT